MRIFVFALLIVILAFVNADAQTSDTIYMVQLQNQEVNSTRIWHNDTLRYNYNQEKFYVKTILPYLKEAVALFNEINQKLNEPNLTAKDRREYIHSKESVVHSRFEEQIKALNETQGVLLIKLAARQTGLNIYHQLADFKGTIPALKWQAWARLHGFNLNRKYHPEEEADLENIMFSLGYPLPPYYGGYAEDIKE